MGLLDFLKNPIGRGWSSLPAVPEQPILHTKLLGTIEDNRGVLTARTLVHGPGASEPTDWQRGDGNSAVFSCLMALAMAYIEPPMRVFKAMRDGQPKVVPASPIQTLLDNPNPAFSLTEILFWIAWAKHADGNAYLRKIRSGGETTGNVVELWPISPLLCSPVTYRDRPTDFISAYRYYYAPGKYEDIPTENIIHVRLGIDDRDHRKGIAPIKRLARHIVSDDEAAKFAQALLQNFAIPGLVVLPAKDTVITAEQAQDLKQRISATFGSDNRGNVGVMSAGADVKQFGFSPSDLNLKELHQIPETRICAVMRVPPAVVGVSVGLEQTSNYASMREVREMFTEGTLLPEWRLDGAKLSRGLVPDFTNDKTLSLAYDTSEVRALQQDQDALYARLTAAVQAGWVQPDEARAEVGLPPLPAAPNPGEQTALTIVKAIAERKALGLGGLPALYEALVQLAEPGLEQDLAGYFDDQKRRLQRRLIGGG